MLVHPQIDPVAFHIGSFQVHWYGIMYLVAFMIVLFLGRRRPAWGMDGWQPKDIDDLLFYGVFGVVLGGRIGYVLFYNLPWYAAHPLQVFAVWEGGMSFHGGLIGVMTAMYLYARRRNWPFLAVADFIAPLVPPGLGAGRLGNFINGELPGRVTHVPWAMIYPQYDNLPRHPSQLYEFTLEGVVLFVVLWLFARKPKPTGAVSALFLIGYGCIRFFLEFFRQPDPQLGLLALGLSMGQWLSIPMILAGIALMVVVYKRR